MKRQIAKSVTMALLLTMTLVTAVATANGQSREYVRAHVPFGFIVGDKTLAAGAYEIVPVGDALSIKSADSKAAVIRLAMTTSPNTKKPARLVFRRYGNTYFLSEVWAGGDRVGRRLNESRHERAVKRELSRIATNGARHYEEVVILAIDR